MFCPTCGAEIPDGTLVCPKCGVSLAAQPQQPQPQPQYNPQPQYSQPQYNTAGQPKAPKSVGGFICSLIGFLFDWVPFLGLIFSIVGVALCSSGKKAVRQNPQAYSGTGLLTAGKVLGILGIIGGVIILIWWIIVVLVYGGTFLGILGAL